MKRGLLLAILVAAAAAATTLPAVAQSVPLRSGFVNNPPQSPHHSSFPRHVFVPGIGFRPVLQPSFPVFGLGFDAHHFHAIHGRTRPGLFLHGGFRSGRFFGGGFFGSFFPVVTSTSVVVVPQVVQVPVPVVVQTVPAVGQGISLRGLETVPLDQYLVPAGPGLPANWSERVQVVRPSTPAAEPTPLPQLTLLVLKDGTIYAVTNYWLEDDRIFYVTSTGTQYSIGLRELDWEMTTRLNAERNVDFVLHSAR